MRNIAQRENFKSSSFVWNKVYLVAFRNTDPLFVFDLEDPTDPNMIWILIIPWYSLYLHPLKYEDGKQYLI